MIGLGFCFVVLWEVDRIRVDLESDSFVVLFQSFFPAMTKIVGTLGPKSRSVEVISGCLKAGMSGTIFASSRFIFFLIINVLLEIRFYFL